MALEVVEVTEQTIHVIITCKTSKVRIVETFVYGLHIIVDRRPLWATLCNLGRYVCVSWVVICDFNVVFESGHKINCNEVSDHEVEDGV